MWAAEPRAESIASSGSSLLCKNFKLLCKFHLQQSWAGSGGGAWQSTESRQPAAGSRLSAVGSLARTKAPGKRHNSSGRSDFMPDFNYQYAPSTWSTDPRLPSLPIPLCVQSNNGHKSFHMPSVWSVLLLLLAQSSRTVAREFRLAMQYFILEQTSTRSFFFWGSQSCHHSVCLSVVVVFFRLFCQLSAAMNLII